jgi:hypothetical protein
MHTLYSILKSWHLVSMWIIATSKLNAKPYRIVRFRSTNVVVIISEICTKKQYRSTYLDSSTHFSTGSCQQLCLKNNFNCAKKNLTWRLILIIILPDHMFTFFLRYCFTFFSENWERKKCLINNKTIIWGTCHWSLIS